MVDANQTRKKPVMTSANCRSCVGTNWTPGLAIGPPVRCAHRQKDADNEATFGIEGRRSELSDHEHILYYWREFRKRIYWQLPTARSSSA